MEKVCIVTGGTGGHIYPALALADKIRALFPGVDILFIGNDDRMESDVVPKAGYAFKALHTSGLVGNVFDKAKAVGQMVRARRQAKDYLKAFKPDIVIGFGGYVSAPVILAAHSLHVPTMIHEQNSIVGKANQLVMNQVDAIVTCYEKCSEVFPQDKIHLLGNPRATVAQESKFDPDYFRSLGLDPDKKTILVMMGSLGSSSVNELMKEALPDADRSLQFLYACGKDNDQDLHLFDGSGNIFVTPYVDTLKIYKKISGIICRAGATTIAEVTALGIPAILIPSPYVANNHQFYNASVLVQAHAARMIEEKDLNAKTLREQIDALFLDETERQLTMKNAKRLGKPHAAYDMIDLCNQLVNASK
jgi:UDP-N-acetylglucosamine--N-acetylmuramyl-(pentapeptide) pyrophosphoryl-undecaprenol N-acetylglucosamine transferase